MKRLLLFLAAVMAFCGGGCATPETNSGPPRVLVALHLAGGGSLTPPQAALVLEALAPVMKSVGFQLADRAEQADYILNATFTPDAIEPNGGRVAIQGFGPVRHEGDRTANPSAATLREMQDRVANLERWALRGQIGR